MLGASSWATLLALSTLSGQSWAVQLQERFGNESYSNLSGQSCHFLTLAMMGPGVGLLLCGWLAGHTLPSWIFGGPGERRCFLDICCIDQDSAASKRKGMD